MDAKLLKQICANMEAKSTEDLLKIWKEKDKEQWSDEAFEVVKQLLIERGETILPPTSIENNDDKQREVQLKSRSLKANKKIVEEAICKICNTKFAIGEDVKQCENCQNYFHNKCWAEKGGCNQPGCKEETKACPMCGKEIKKSALKCRHCGQYLDETIRARQIPKGRVKEASKSLTYAIIGIIIFGFILGWVAISNGRKALKKIEEDPGYTGKGMAIAGIIIGVLDILGWIVAIISRR